MNQALLNSAPDVGLLSRTRLLNVEKILIRTAENYMGLGEIGEIGGDNLNNATAEPAPNWSYPVSNTILVVF